MGLLDRFKPKPHPVVAWLEAHGDSARHLPAVGDIERAHELLSLLEA